MYHKELVAIFTLAIKRPVLIAVLLVKIFITFTGKSIRNIITMKTNPRTGIAVIFACILLFVVAGCNEDSNFFETLFSKKVKISGKIDRSKSGSSDNQKNTDNDYTLDQAEKVLIFYGRKYDLVNIRNDGSFSGRAPLGSATAVAFLTENNEFIGNLFVGGINFLPLVSDNGELSEIDLEELTLDGDRVIPANDPLGSQIILSEAELEFMNEVGAYYRSLSKNIDMNNNITPDVMEHGIIDITICSNFFAGKFGVNNSAAELGSFDASSINYTIFMEGPIEWISSSDNSIPENAYISGPADDPCTDLRNAGNSYSNNSNFKVNFARGLNDGVFLPFPAGIYTLHIDNQEFTFYYSNLNTFNYWVLAIPTLITNSENQVTHIQLHYQFPDGTEIDPQRLLSTGISIDISGENYNNILSQLYESGDGSDPEYDYHNIELETPISLDDIQSVRIGYGDLFGNECGNSWGKQLTQYKKK